MRWMLVGTGTATVAVPVAVAVMAVAVIVLGGVGRGGRSCGSMSVEELLSFVLSLILSCGFWTSLES